MVSLLLLVSIFVSASPSFANELESDSDGTVVGVTDLTSPDPNTEISEVLTFDELVNEISVNEGISKKKAAEQIKASMNSNSSNSKSDSTLLASSSDAVTAESATYRSISAQFTVTSSYKPTLRFYCSTSEGGGYWGITKILNVSMNRSYDGMSKQFGGSVYTNLETAYRIFWVVDGDFYNNGTTTGGGGVSIGVGGSASIDFNVSNSSNHYKYCYVEGLTVTQ